MAASTPRKTPAKSARTPMSSRQQKQQQYIQQFHQFLETEHILPVKTAPTMYDDIEARREMRSSVCSDVMKHISPEVTLPEGMTAVWMPLATLDALFKRVTGWDGQSDVAKALETFNDASLGPAAFAHPQVFHRGLKTRRKSGESNARKYNVGVSLALSARLMALLPSLPACIEELDEEEKEEQEETEYDVEETGLEGTQKQARNAFYNSLVKELETKDFPASNATIVAICMPFDMKSDDALDATEMAILKVLTDWCVDNPPKLFKVVASSGCTQLNIGLLGNVSRAAVAAVVDKVIRNLAGRAEVEHFAIEDQPDVAVFKPRKVGKRMSKAAKRTVANILARAPAGFKKEEFWWYRM